MTHADDPDCLFCKILRGEIPSTKVAETDAAYAFRDINPAMPTHVLVIPRNHIANAHELDPSEHAADRRRIRPEHAERPDRQEGGRAAGPGVG